MSLLVDGETISIFGAYVLNEDAAGNVSSVELKFNLGNSDLTIATLTNIVVVETDDDLSATFDVVLSIPEEADFEACNTLQGEYTAEKEEPMAESLGAAADFNHVKLIKTWTLSSAVFDGVDGLSDILDDPCYYEDDNQDYIIECCSIANSLSLSFSAFGSYSFVWLGSIEGTVVETDSWSWVGTDYTSFFVGEIGNEDVVEISSLTDTEVVFIYDGAVLTFIAK
jgi:hypothetical protein